MTITWKNVGQLDSSAELAAIGQAGKNISSGLSGLGDFAAGIGQQIQDRTDRKFEDTVFAREEEQTGVANTIRGLAERGETMFGVKDVNLNTGKVELLSDKEILAKAPEDLSEGQKALWLAQQKADALAFSNEFDSTASQLMSDEEWQEALVKDAKAAGYSADKIRKIRDSYQFDVNKNQFLTQQQQNERDFQQRVIENNMLTLQATYAQEEAMVQNKIDTYTSKVADYQNVGNPAEAIKLYAGKTGADIPSDDNSMQELTNDFSQAYNKIIETVTDKEKQELARLGIDINNIPSEVLGDTLNNLSLDYPDVWGADFALKGSGWLDDNAKVFEQELRASLNRYKLYRGNEEELIQKQAINRQALDSAAKNYANQFNAFINKQSDESLMINRRGFAANRGTPTIRDINKNLKLDTSTDINPKPQAGSTIPADFEINNSATPKSNKDDFDKAITKAEAPTYDTPHKKLGDYYKAQGESFNITGSSIQEVINEQNRIKDSGMGYVAMGKYQFMPDSLQDALNAGIVDPNETFSPEVQDRLAFEYPYRFKKAVRDYIDADNPTKAQEEAALVGLSQVWAGLPKDESGESFYKGRAGNKANISYADGLKAVRAFRSRYLSEFA